MIWFGTMGGVSRYDGRDQALKKLEQRDVGDSPHFTSFTDEDGMVNNRVIAIHIDPEGIMCFGTGGAGVACYDGTAWTSLDTSDGLADNKVQCIHRDVDGSLWFGTEGGLTRYRPSTVLPKAQIVSVTADRIYTELDDLPAFILGTRVTIEYSSIDFLTVPEKRQYRIRVRELDRDWRKPTRDTAFDCTFDKPGTYTFEVQAINRDLNYSEPASLSLTIEPDPVLMSMQTELSYLRREVGRKYNFENIIGRSVGITQVRALMERAIDSGLTVLISGETGTGKELVAKAIHHNSQRRDHPLLDLNCGAVSKELISSTLFGHRKGAFTGAQDDQIGLFEAASGGTVLLDEISEMPQDAQIHLLRVLEEHKIQRLGEHVSRDVDVRIIAMTNQDLMKEVKAGRFREDLYYRLSVFPIRIPPLRERSEDIPILAEHFLQETDRRLSGFAPGVFEMLQSYSWPGNVRELRNAVHRAAALAEEEIQTYHFPSEITQGESLIKEIASEQIGLSASVELLQRRLIENALRECNGNHTYAARMLNMHRSNFVRLMRRLGIEYPDVSN
jgi:two-component system response regulator HydG